MSDTDRITKLKKLLEVDQNDTFCLYGLGQEYAKAGDCAKALEFFERTIDVDPNHVYAYFFRARMLEALDRLDEAKATLEQGFVRAQESGDEKGAKEIGEYLGSLGE